MLNENPLVTLIMFTYRFPQFLPTALYGIKSQTYANTETIIISVEGDVETDEVLQKHNGNWFKWLKSEKPNNVHQFNMGINEAQGEYLAMCAADDFVLPSKIASEVQVAVKTGALMVYSNFFYANSNLEIIGVTDLPSFSYMQLVKRNFMPDMALIHRKLYDEFGVFDETLGAMAFFDKWLRIAEKYSDKIILQPTPNYLYRKHGGQLSEKMSDPARLETRRRIVETSLDRMGIPHGKIQYQIERV